MNVFFIGCVEFSENALKCILEIDAVNVVGVATKSKSDFNADHRDLSSLAIDNGIPYKYVKDINAPHIVEWIKSLQPDYIFCFGWSSLLKKDLLDITPNKVIGFHPAKLPYNRGRHPIIWALVLGISETASSFFRMDEAADSGDILSQELIQITDETTANDLYERITQTAISQIKEFVPKLITNSAIWIKQDISKGNEWRKRERKDGLIDFRMTSNAIKNLVRALSKPYPGAEISLNGELFQIWKVSLGSYNANNIEPGKVLSVMGNKIEIKTGDSSIVLEEHTLTEMPLEGEYIR